MFEFSRSDLQRMAVSTVGALVLSTACVVGAVAPARAEAPASLAAWQADVQRQIGAQMSSMPAPIVPYGAARATVAMRFDAAGKLAGASVVGRTGNDRLDREAVRIAQAIRYPEFPATHRGRSQQVEMNIYFGESQASIDRLAAREQRLAAKQAQGTRLAAR